MPADGSAEPRALSEIASGEAYVEFAPDGKKLMVNRMESGTTLLIDVESGAQERLPDTIKDPATWQRLAP